MLDRRRMGDSPARASRFGGGSSGSNAASSCLFPLPRLRGRAREGGVPQVRAVELATLPRKRGRGSIAAPHRKNGNDYFAAKPSNGLPMDLSRHRWHQRGSDGILPCATKAGDFDP